MLTYSCIFIVCKTIVDVHICNGQLKICRPFIFNCMVFHLVVIAKWRTMWLNMKVSALVRVTCIPSSFRGMGHGFQHVIQISSIPFWHYLEPYWFNINNVNDFVRSLGSTRAAGSLCDPHNVLYDPLCMARNGAAFSRLVSAWAAITLRTVRANKPKEKIRLVW